MVTATKTAPRTKFDKGTQIYDALSLLRKNTWVKRAKIAEKLGTNDLRALRHLRGFGYEIDVKRGKNGYEYRRLNG